MDTPAVDISNRDNAVLVRLTGTASIAAAALLREKFLHTKIDKDLMVDWKEAEYVDTSVLQVLLAVSKVLPGRGFSLGVVNDSATVRHYLEIAGLSDEFPLQDSESISSPDSAPHA
jgi:anti-anti-sigma factor